MTPKMIGWKKIINWFGKHEFVTAYFFLFIIAIFLFSLVIIGAGYGVEIMPAM